MRISRDYLDLEIVNAIYAWNFTIQTQRLLLTLTTSQCGTTAQLQHCYTRQFLFSQHVCIANTRMCGIDKKPFTIHFICVYPCMHASTYTHTHTHNTHLLQLPLFSPQISQPSFLPSLSFGVSPHHPLSSLLPPFLLPLSSASDERSLP